MEMCLLSTPKKYGEKLLNNYIKLFSFPFLLYITHKKFLSFPFLFLSCSHEIWLKTFFTFSGTSHAVWDLRLKHFMSRIILISNTFTTFQCVCSELFAFNFQVSLFWHTIASILYGILLFHLWQVSLFFLTLVHCCPKDKEKEEEKI